MEVQVDIVILGSGISSLYLAKILEEYSVRYLIIDYEKSLGGSISLMEDLGIRYPRMPILLFEIPEKYRLYANNCFSLENIEVLTIKEGDFLAKCLGFLDPQRFQEPWIYRWIHLVRSLHKAYLATSLVRNIVSSFKNFVNFLRASIVRIDAARKVIVTHHGCIVKYRKLVSTIPMDVLLNKIANLPKEIVAPRIEVCQDTVGLLVLTVVRRRHSDDAPRILIHGTKASRFVAMLLIPFDQLSLIYVLAPFSSAYPPLPGFTEKLFSELRKFNVCKDSEVLSERTFITLYAALSRIENLERFANDLRTLDIYVHGRCGSWREGSVWYFMELSERLASELAR